MLFPHRRSLERANLSMVVGDRCWTFRTTKSPEKTDHIWFQKISLNQLFCPIQLLLYPFRSFFCWLHWLLCTFHLTCQSISLAFVFSWAHLEDSSVIFESKPLMRGPKSPLRQVSSFITAFSPAIWLVYSEIIYFNNQIWCSEELQKSEIFTDKTQKPNSKQSCEKYKTFSFMIFISVPLSASRNNLISAIWQLYRIISMELTNGSSEWHCIQIYKTSWLPFLRSTTAINIICQILGTSQKEIRHCVV
jgi:hypothetical protein